MTTHPLEKRLRPLHGAPLLSALLALAGCGESAATLGRAHIEATTESRTESESERASEEDATPVKHTWDLASNDCTPEGIRSRLPTTSELKGWNDMLRLQGTRFAGSPAHATFTAFLKTQLANAGAVIKSYPSKATLWKATAFELATLDANGVMTPRPTATYYPNSGSGTITAQAVAVRTALFGKIDWRSAAGKIAVVKWSPPALTVETMRGGNDPIWWKDTSVPGIDLKAPYMQGPSTLAYPNLSSGAYGIGAAAAGVLGVLVTADMPEALLAEQYGAFAAAYAGVPALVLGPDGSKWVNEAVTRKEKVRLTLKATRTPITAESLVATLPGTDPAQNGLLLITHTDGPNEVEENGALGLLAIAKAITPCNRRTIKLIMVAGHMNSEVHTTESLLKLDPSIYTTGGDFTRRISVIGAIAMEHLGAKHFSLNASGTFGYAGDGTDPGMAFVSASGKADHLKDAFIAAAEANGIDRSFISGLSRIPMIGVLLGEGIGADKSGIRTFGYAPMPDTLLKIQAAGTNTPEFVDIGALERQIRTFSDMVTTLQDKKYDRFAGKDSL